MELQMQNFSFGYIKKPLCLKSINLSVKSGETAVIMGGEGMGKTTLLRALCLLEEQYVGFIKLNGRDIKGYVPNERRISYLPSSPIFLESKTLKDNLNYLFEVENMPPLSDQKILEIFNIFSFEKSLYERVKKLTLFEKRMFAIIRSYIKNPNILLIDEQTEGLTNEDIKIIKNAISVLINDKNAVKITIMACYNANLIDLGNKFFYISYGIIQERKSLDEVKSSALDLFITNYFNVKTKSLILSREDSGYYLKDYKVSYKNAKKQKGEFVEVVRKIKLSSLFNDSLNNTNLGLNEELKVVLVYESSFDLSVSDREFDKALQSKIVHLFEEETGVRIL